MGQRRSERIYGAIALLLLAAGIVLAEFFWQGRLGFSLWDEGFLWYGVQRVMLGEVPIRDFWSYDPGRYYWSAAPMAWFGDPGIMALRTSVAVFQAMGLFAALVLLKRSSKASARIFLLLAAVTLTVWMFPRHKLFDISLSILFISALTFLIQNPTGRRCFVTGLVVGLAAVFGRNHGLYGVVGSLGVMAYLAFRSEAEFGPAKALSAWGAGVFTGYLPVLLLIATVPDFAKSFWGSLLFVFETKTINLSLPVPWPWCVPFGSVTAIAAARGALTGLFFMAIVFFGLAGIAWVIRRRFQKKPVPPVVVASVFMALPYAHHVYRRPDISHLAQGIFPFLIGCFVLLANRSAKIKWPLAAILCSASLLVMLPEHPGWQCRASGNWVETDVAGNKLIVDPGTANDLALLNKLDGEFSTGGRSFVVVPYWPGAYAVLKRKAPLWELFPLFPRSDAFQQAEIERIKAASPGFAIILDDPLDGMDARRFRNTNPLIDRYIRENFERIDGFSKNQAYQIYKSRQGFSKER